MKVTGIQFLVWVITSNSFVMAQDDFKINSRIDGKLINLTHHSPAGNRLNEAILFDDADKTFMAIRNAPLKKYVVLEKGTHVMRLEKGRYQLYRETLHFLTSSINHE